MATQSNGKIVFQKDNSCAIITNHAKSDAVSMLVDSSVNVSRNLYVSRPSTTSMNPISSYGTRQHSSHQLIRGSRNIPIFNNTSSSFISAAPYHGTNNDQSRITFYKSGMEGNSSLGQIPNDNRANLYLRKSVAFQSNERVSKTRQQKTRTKLI